MACLARASWRISRASQGRMNRFTGSRGELLSGVHSRPDSASRNARLSSQTAALLPNRGTGRLLQAFPACQAHNGVGFGGANVVDSAFGDSGSRRVARQAAFSSVPAAGHAQASDDADSEGGDGRRDTPVIVTSRAEVPGRKETEEIGLVSAADVRSKNVLKDVMAALGGILGGETTYYSHLLNEASQAAMDKMVHHAEGLGADAVVNVRFQTTTTMNRLIIGLHATVLVYGTAVKLEPAEGAAGSTKHVHGKVELPK